uniref:Uncharacterized protein n=1 Tax=Physcomitrium patens TaxID=3218 RepID=A0A2K1K2L0_PHYPA|nr:hypothetical protein PHYPA_012486 [Physcomitrium patens]
MSRQSIGVLERCLDLRASTHASISMDSILQGFTQSKCKPQLQSEKFRASSLTTDSHGPEVLLINKYLMKDYTQ